jgi:phosphate transport system permease protein
MSIRTNAPSNYGGRKVIDSIMRGLTVAATLIAIVPLVLIIGYVTVIGGSALTPDFFTKTYEPPAMAGDTGLDPANAAPAFDPNAGAIPVATADPNVTPDPNATADPFAGIGVGGVAGVSGDVNATPDPNVTPDPNATADPFAGVDVGGATSGQNGASGVGDKGAGLSAAQARGGVLHAMIGTLLVTGLALLLSLPIGVLSGVFLAEYPSNSVATMVRFCTDLLSGSPSIIAGVTAYILIVVRYKEFSGVAGAIALTFLMVPTITRTTEEVLKLVPESVREAALAMGAPTWYSTFTIVIPSAMSGIVTGVMLAFARGAGETAPLILTVLGSNVLVFNLLEPIAALPLITYRYTESPFPGENVQAWGSAFILMMLVLVVNISVRLATRNRLRGR